MRSEVSMLIAGCGIAQFARIARDVQLGRARRYDRPIRRFIRARQNARLDVVSEALVAMSAPGVAVPVTLGTAVVLRNRGAAAWLPIALSPLVAMTAGRLFTALLPQQFAPNDIEKKEPSFPSGHTTGLTAEALTTAYVLVHEGVLGRGAALLLCAFPIVAGINRVYRDRHWASDVVAGWAAGVTVAALCALAYDHINRRSLP